MKDNNQIKNKWLHLRLSPAEYDQINKAFSNTTERKISRYARSILLGKPIIGTYRNLSADELIKEFSILVKTLNGIGNNLNQSVHKLHTLSDYPAIKAWLGNHEGDMEILLKDIATIKDYLKEFSGKWLQS